MGACAHARYGGSRATPLAQEPFSQHARTQEPTLYSSCGEALSRASPLAQEPFSKQSPTRRRQFGHSFIARGQKRFLEQPPLAQEPSSKDPLTRMPACARCSVSRGISFSGEPSRSRAFLKARADKEKLLLRGNAFSSEPSRPRAFLKAPSDKNVRAHAYYKEALPRAAPLAQEPFSKNALTKKSRLAHSFILRGSAFSGEPSRARAFFKALLDKGAPALAFMSCCGAKAFSSNPSRERAFLKASSDKGAGAYVHSYCGEVLSRATPLAQ